MKNVPLASVLDAIEAAPASEAAVVERENDPLPHAFGRSYSPTRWQVPCGARVTKALAPGLLQSAASQYLCPEEQRHPGELTK